jgi:hypothetical protein
VGLLLAAVGLLLYFFQQFPIEGTSLAIDWKGLWAGLRADPPLYGNATGLRIAPWDVLLVKPLGWLPFRASWGMLTLLTLAVLVASVPRNLGKKRFWLGSVLLVTSYPAIRHIADGNVEGLMVAGLLLVVWGYQSQKPWLLAAGLLLASAKGQEMGLLAVVLGIYLLRTWPRRRLLALAAYLAAVIIPSLLWLGREWILGASAIQERGSLVDSSLWATLSRLGLPAWLILGCWLALAALIVLYACRSKPSFSRPKAAALVAASLLLAPYAAGNSYLTVLAVGLLPVVLEGNALAVILMILVDLPYLAGRDLVFSMSANYWTAVLALTLGMLALFLWPFKRHAPGPSSGALVNS